MDISIPFPTLSRLGEESDKMEERRALHSRTHSSPTTPSFSLPIDPSGFPSRHHLRQVLDLASFPSAPPFTSPLSLKTKKLSLTSVASAHSFSTSSNTDGSPRRAPSLNTPPLTPSSSFNSSSHDTASDFTPTTPEPVSPIRWAQSASTDQRHTGRSMKALHSYTTPSNVRSRSLSSSDGPAVELLASGMRGVSLSSPNIASTAEDLTPRLEKAFSLASKGRSLSQERTKSFEQFFEMRKDAKPSRFILVRNIPPLSSSSDALLRAAFQVTGEVRGIFVRYLESHGIAVLAYFDLRVAKAAVGKLDGKWFDELCFGETINAKTLDRKNQKYLEAVWVDPVQLGSITDQTAFVAETNATFYLTLRESFTDSDSIKRILMSFGELVTLDIVSSEEHEQTFRVEYNDIREAQSAYASLHNRPMFSARLSVRPEWIPSGGSVSSSSASQVFAPARLVDITSPMKKSTPLLDNDTDHRGWYRATGPGERMNVETDQRHTTDDFDDPFVHRSILPSLRFDRDEHVFEHSRHNVGRRASIGPNDYRTSRVPQESSLGLMSPPSTYNTQPLAEMPVYRAPLPSSFPVSFPSASLPAQPGFDSRSSVPTPLPPMHPVAHVPFIYPGSPPPLPDAFMTMHSDGFGHHHYRQEHWLYSPHLQSRPVVPSFSPAPPPGMHIAPTSGYGHYGAPHFPASYPSASQKLFQSSHAIDSTDHHNLEDSSFRPSDPFPFHVPKGSPNAFRNLHARNSSRFVHPFGGAYNERDSVENAEKNQLDLANIENGVDMRTTVMIKNIPNKMSDADLLEFINRVCPRRIDFLYLRMDFQNGCNVGYAFVNFITVQDLLYFARTQLGVKWNMYSSEKTLQLSYANYQGKEALVEKFKNSCIMDERESWRPKIFYSFGPEEGLPEPFPAPTHLRRKERSAHNRGALFVPGSGIRHGGDGFGKEGRFSRM